MRQEVSQMINRNFPDIQKAYEFFAQSKTQTSIDFTDFSKAINSLFPQRFIESDTQDLWKLYAGSSQVIGKE